MTIYGGATDIRVATAYARGFNDARDAARRAQPCTAENPNESTYERGKFDGVIAYASAIAALKPKEQGE